jgi:hypothetical protein
LNIRIATASDINDIVPIVRQHQKAHGQENTVEAVLQYLTRILSQNHTKSFILLASCGGKIVGFSHITRSFSSLKMNTILYSQDIFAEESANQPQIISSLIQEMAKVAHKESCVLSMLKITEDYGPVYHQQLLQYGWIKDEKFLTYIYQIGKGHANI